MIWKSDAELVLIPIFAFLTLEPESVNLAFSVTRIAVSSIEDTSQEVIEHDEFSDKTMPSPMESRNIQRVA
jgi:hypothetical protein